MPTDDLDPDIVALAAAAENPTATPAADDQPRGDDGKFVPQDTYDSVVRERDADRERLARSEADNAELRKPPTSATQSPTEKEFKFYSAKELSTAVEKGLIDEDQKTEQLQLQGEKRTEKVVRDTIRSERQTQSNVDGVEGYLALMPNLHTNGSEEHKKFAAEWDFQIKNGAPNSEGTKMSALRSAFGPLDRLQRAKGVSDASAPKSAHEEVGNRGDNPPAANNGDLWAKLSTGDKATYDAMISRGLYANRAAVVEELKFAQTQTVNLGLRAKSITV